MALSHRCPYQSTRSHPRKHLEVNVGQLTELWTDDINELCILVLVNTAFLFFGGFLHEVSCLISFAHFFQRQTPSTAAPVGLCRGNSRLNFPTVPPSPSGKSSMSTSQARSDAPLVDWCYKLCAIISFAVDWWVVAGLVSTLMPPKQEIISELAIPSAPSLPQPPRQGCRIKVEKSKKSRSWCVKALPQQRRTFLALSASFASVSWHVFAMCGLLCWQIRLFHQMKQITFKFLDQVPCRLFCSELGNGCASSLWLAFVTSSLCLYLYGVKRYCIRFFQWNTFGKDMLMTHLFAPRL